MADLFGANCIGINNQERARDWQERLWFGYFKAFWEAIAEHFAPRLWPLTKGDWLPPNVNPNQLDNTQRERQKLLRATVLGLLQTALLEVWADAQESALKLHGRALAELKIAPEDFKSQISSRIKALPADFFTDLKYAGFDASKDVRQDLTKLMVQALKEIKSMADIKEHLFYK
jgi:hypothetical protein